MAKICKICDTNVSKYKCPTCSVAYCSVPCYKCHKEKCIKLAPLETNQQQSSVNNVFSDKTYEFATENTVPVKKLKLLRYNTEVLNCLKNPHLQDMLRHLNSSSQPTVEIAKAIKEPIFYEFASECLKEIDDDVYLYTEKNGALE